MRLGDFRVLTFDCYGTLIDWESGILAALSPLMARAGVAREAALEAFGRHESGQEAETPRMLYAGVLAEVHRRLAREWDVAAAEAEHAAFGASVPDWPAFPDSPGALAYLKRHFALVVLSNVDHASFAGSAKRLGVAFDAVHTAQDIGSYKPSDANFRYLLDRLAEAGFAPGKVLHTAQSLFHDHVPAKRAGLATAWIDRRHDREGWGATPPPEGAVTPDFRFPSLEAMAAAHRGEIGGA